MAKKQAAQPSAPPRYTKAQLLGATRYREKRDVLEALLRNERKYTHEEVAELVKKFNERKVK